MRTAILLTALVASSALAVPLPLSETNSETGNQRSINEDDIDVEVYARQLADDAGELDERFFFLAPLISQGIRAGVQAGVRAGARAGAKKVAQKGAKHAAKKGASRGKNNRNNRKKHKRSFEELDVQRLDRDLTEYDSELDERFFFLAPLISQGIRAGVQAGVKAGARAGAKKAAQKGAKHAAKKGASHSNCNGAYTNYTYATSKIRNTSRGGASRDYQNKGEKGGMIIGDGKSGV